MLLTAFVTDLIGFLERLTINIVVLQFQVMHRPLRGLWEFDSIGGKLAAFDLSRRMLTWIDIAVWQSLARTLFHRTVAWWRFASY